MLQHATAIVGIWYPVSRHFIPLRGCWHCASDLAHTALQHETGARRSHRGSAAGRAQRFLGCFPVGYWDFDFLGATSASKVPFPLQLRQLQVAQRVMPLPCIK